MKVEFLINYDIDMTPAKEKFAVILADLAQQIGTKPEWIDRVVVADSERFAEALASFGGTRKYTNTHGLLAVAKTIRMPNTNPVQTSIVFNTSVVGIVMDAAIKKGWQVESWTVEEQRSFYVLLHELGHCADHAVRPVITADGTRRDENGERVVDHTLGNLHAYHFSEMYPEIPACVFGGYGYTEEIRALDMAMNNEALRSMLRELAQLTESTPPSFGAIFKQAMAVFWFILFQHAKFTGSALGNAKLPQKPSGELWDIAARLPEVAEALNRAEASVVSAWQVYPQIPDTFRKELTECFHDIAFACGYLLEVRAGADGVWWDRPLLLQTLRLLDPEMAS
ncbi:MAG TPA: hypothetical protein VGM73_03805 [Candidatus Didemnitutus sp.]|jgi:hypothetical protein